MPTMISQTQKNLRENGALRFRDIPTCRYSLTTDHEKHIYSKREFLRIYRDMRILRELSAMLYNLHTKGEHNGISHPLTSPIRPTAFEEAIAVGEAYCMEKSDRLFGSCDSLCHVAAKGLAAIERRSDNELVAIMKIATGGETLAPIADRANNNMSIKELCVRFFLYGLVSEIFGKRTGFCRGLGGAEHVCFPPFGIYPASNVPAGSAGFAVGAALYAKSRSEKSFSLINLREDELNIGAVTEAMRLAADEALCEKEGKTGGLPVLFAVTSHKDFSASEESCDRESVRIGAGISPDMLHAERVDGLSPMAVIDAVARKKELLERGEGPVLIEFITQCAGSEQDFFDAKSYDPITLYREKLLQDGVAKESDLSDIDLFAKRILADVASMAADDTVSGKLSVEEIEALVFAGTEPKRTHPSLYPDVMRSESSCTRVMCMDAKERYGFDANGDPIAKNKRYNLSDAIFEPIFSRFYTDPSFFLLASCEDRHGVFSGMEEAIPSHRFYRAPISESALLSCAIGYAMCGGRIAVEIAQAGLFMRAGSELACELAKWRMMSGGMLNLPILIRIPVDKNAGTQLTEEIYSFVSGIPGLKVVYPVTPYDMKGLLEAALSEDDPVILFEHTSLYDIGEGFREKGVPMSNFTIPLATAEVKREGKDLTVLTIGAALYRAIDAADTLMKAYNLSAEVIDARSLVPFDYETVLASVRKTGRLLILGDGFERVSVMRDIASNIAEMAFYELDAPPVVVGTRNLIAAKETLPKTSDILDAIHQKILPLSDYTPHLKFDTAEKIRRAKEGI